MIKPKGCWILKIIIIQFIKSFIKKAYDFTYFNFMSFYAIIILTNYITLQTYLIIIIIKLHLYLYQDFKFKIIAIAENKISKTFA